MLKNHKLVILIAISIAACLIATFVLSPEFTMLRAIHSVKENGLSGLYDYLNNDGKQAIEKILLLTDNRIANFTSNLLLDQPISEILASGVSSIDWTIDEIIKSGDKAVFSLHFNYQDKFSGDIEVDLQREGVKWKIYRIEIPISGFLGF